ncbi:TraR/DksA family transcriptional regulator [bacterium]|nr:TraR/DksA family transcriptional regulator [bacterium]
MNKKDIGSCKKKLLEIKAEIERELFGDKSESLGINSKDASGNLSTMPLHLADVGTDNYNRDFNLDIASNKSNLLRLVDNALRKIEKEGNYAKCEVCSEKINKQRLFAMPYVPFCIECQEKMEKRE